MNSRVDLSRGRSLAARLLSVAAVIFGLMTLKGGASVLFDLGTLRAAHPHYVPFVLWFNTLSGFIYITAGIGLWLRRRWARLLSSTLVLGLVAISMGLAVHIATGRAYDVATLVAMAVRLIFWTCTAAFARFIWIPQNDVDNPMEGSAGDSL